MNILILYLVATGDLKTVYDADGKYDHIEVGAYVQDSSGVTGWVVDLPGCVQEGNRILREEREWLLEQGKQYAQTAQSVHADTQEPTIGTAVLLYNAKTDSLATVFDCEQRYSARLGTAVDGTYAVSLWHDCTADSIPVFMQAEQLEPAYREFFLNQGRAYVQTQTTATTPL